MYIASLKVKQQKNRKKTLYCVKKGPVFALCAVLVRSAFGLTSFGASR